MPTEPNTSEQERWMQRALDLAERGAGAVSPNPLVGAVVVGPGGTMLGEGWHGEYGGPHAEVWAVRDVERRHGAEALRESTLYVTLEPCSHHGKTPPCADLIVEKSIPRVVVGMTDPFPAVAGRGIERLRAHGVDVTVGVLESGCKRLNEAFVHHVATGRPLVTLKIAQTLDGSVATASGDSRWVTGEAARTLVHRWRAELDGVLVGSGTAAADDPALTVRHVEGRQPVRVVLDRPGMLRPNLKLFTDAHAAQTVAVVGEGATPDYAAALEDLGGLVLTVPERDGHLDFGALLDRLGAGVGAHRPMQSLLVEAGPGLATALLRADPSASSGQALADRLALFIAPKLVGGQRAVDNLGIGRMADARTFETHRWEAVGPDMLFFGYRRAF
ncbi:MAG: bifunctional diaminohydroxyphosphoribosylaminopyrimidine deaminase/5-amino-6-(5-phosphoribosylamino)uracil reductase RibD [Rhodothermales bacterium]